MPATFGDVYERLVRAWPDPRERGREFEPLVARVLETDSLYRHRFAKVWRFAEWPGRRSGDIGVDLVAQRFDGGLTAIQVKCYDPGATLYESQLATFLANTNADFDERLVVSTTPRWSNNLLALISNQRPPVQRLDLFGLEATTVDWDRYLEDEAAPLAERPRKTPRPHQEAALAAVRAGLEAHDRGKLVMACGTGKTYTALLAAEEIAGRGGRVLFAAPSISLVAQALREWTADASMPIRAFAVCSDARVGRGDGDGARPYDLPIPATTDPARLAEAAAADRPDALTVVFSTYQSMGVIRDAQAAGMPEFALAVCDEAHRTTGYALDGEERSAFLLVHDAEAVRARKRLYMTATPRIYAPAARAKAAEADAFVASMDDEAAYGPELHRLGFADAVERELLSDYKVAILVVDEAQIAREYQAELAGGEGLAVGDVGRVVGCLNGLAKLDPEEREFRDDPRPMRSAVAFSNTIKASQRFTELVEQLQDDAGRERRGIHAEAHHVDGKSGVLERGRQLEWLGAPDEARQAEPLVMERQCHVLSNARCLTEGIDVPALDAVLFLQPRKSQIDVVQAVGRVMRRAEGKRYGYVILPVVVPAGEDPGAVLRGGAYAHVWEVLQALRSHDERFEAWANKLELNRNRDGRVAVIGVGSRGGAGDGAAPAAVREDAAQYVLAGLEQRIEQWREAIFVNIVRTCGERRYWEQWSDSVAGIARRHHERIRALIAQPTPAGARFSEFVAALKRNLNDSVTHDDAAAMLSQHLVTKPVFDALFGGSEFTARNPVSQAMQSMLGELEDLGLGAETEELASFYDSVRRRVDGIDNAEGRQRVAAELYDRFFRTAYRRDAERLGIVYTPVEIVDFIVRAVADLLRSEFGASLGDEGVHVLDPFTGTGTFVARLLQSGLIPPADLPRKYRSEIHANEIMLLAYYIAAVNVENAYRDALAAAGLDEPYEPFPGIVLADTFQSAEPGEGRATAMFPRNSERIERQLGLDIRVILGNPPWSTGQSSHNDDNQNLSYPALDTAISKKYVETSTAGSKYQAVYDAYVRGIRWASERVLGNRRGGIVAYVTNGGFIDSKVFDGFRKTLAREFHAIHVYNLRGNQRTLGEQSRREGGKIFGSGSRAGVAILLLVKRPAPVPETGADIRYRDIGDYLTQEQKLARVAASNLGDSEWEPIDPNQYGDWIHQRSERFIASRPLASIRSQPPGSPLFTLASNGLSTGRDAWVFSSSDTTLKERVPRMVAFFNDQVEVAALGHEVDRDPAQFSWDLTMEPLLNRRVRLSVNEAGHRTAAYRPFFKQHLYFDQRLNGSRYQLPRVFPLPETRTPVIVAESRLRAPGRAPTILAVNVVPDLHLGPDAVHVFPRYVYDAQPSGAEQGELTPRGAIAGASMKRQRSRRDNITDEALAAYRRRYGDGVTKDDVFAYVYGVLHSPEYRERYATDLAKMLPRIPEVATASAFRGFAEAGQRLLDLHIGYEEAAPWALREEWAAGAPAGDARWRVEKMRWAGTRAAPDRSAIAVSEWLTLSGIPAEAHEYVVGPRSALEWLIDRYRVRVDKASGIVNDPNDWGLERGEPSYIAELVKRIVTVSVETVRVVRALPPLDEAEPSG